MTNLVDAPAASAANAGDFNPGLIISDALFYDSNAMSQAEIQAFLESKEPGACGASGCLKLYRTDTTNKAAYYSDTSGKIECTAYAGAPGELASTIIYKVQQACGISAKVILVTLQKERGLVTKTSPEPADFKVAMGYGCPDTAACDTLYYGLFNQVYSAAKQFKAYKAAPQFFNFRAGRTSNILYNPSAACGTQLVYVGNHATAALYNYTPYVPNAAALANLYGTGDGCSSYGNRNFFAYYTDWFGPTGTIGLLRIEEAYARWGGAAGVLGAPIGTPNPINANGGGLVQGYAGGAIAWSQAHGAFVVMGDIREYYATTGGVGGFFGWPASDPVPVAANGGGLVQSFAGGAITSSPAGGTRSLTGAMRGYYNTVGGLGGPLGWPSSDQDCSVSGYCTQAFIGGVAYLPTRGAGHYLTLAFDETYRAYGGLSGSLGTPATDPILFSSNGGGVVQGFSTAALAGANGAPAYPLVGDLRGAYNETGGTVGPLGWPTAEGSCSAGVCSQTFQAGTLYWSKATGARYSLGAIGAAYAVLGATSSSLGWPVTGMISFSSNGGGTVQGFGKAAMASSAAGTFMLSGEVRNQYNAAGGTTGPLGWPTAAQSCAADICSQAFQNGVVYASNSKQGYSLGAISSAYSAAGGPSSGYGWPVTGMNDFAANGGGTVQGFEHAAFATSASGTFALSGGMRLYYDTHGGIGGVLGWPTGAMSCVGEVCTQTFQGGALEYSSVTGGRVL